MDINGAWFGALVTWTLAVNWFLFAVHLVIGTLAMLSELVEVLSVIETALFYINHCIYPKVDLAIAVA
tara:strand:- start:10 stop:213 length:204 start_codon:yes stop_codon:yes gene_type:complete